MMLIFTILAILSILSSKLSLVSAADPTCISLQNSTMCDSWSEYSVLSSDDFTTVEEFDTYISRMSVNNNNESFKNLNECYSWDGSSTRRYYTSVLCAVMVDISTNNKCNKKSTDLCKSTVDTAITSINETLDTNCPSETAFRNVFEGSMGQYLNQTHPKSNCILSTKAEWGTCGFITLSEAQDFCSEEENKSEKCCAAVANFAAGLDYEVPSTGMSQSTKTAIICGVVFGVLGLILIIILAVILIRRRRKQNDYPKDLQTPYNMQHQMMYDIKQPNYSNTDSANLSAARAGTNAVNNAYDNSQNISGMASSINSGGDVQPVLYNYVPNLSDEIYLYTGDEIEILKRFDDGWAYGKNLTTLQTGSFPLACIEGNNEPVYNEPTNNRTSNRFSVRASSIGWFPNGRNDKVVSYTDTIDNRN